VLLLGNEFKIQNSKWEMGNAQMGRVRSFCGRKAPAK
jgi:hypothetical protein